MQPQNPFSSFAIAKTIDHALLKQELGDHEVIAGCELAANFAVFSVCVKPCHIELAKRELQGSEVLVGTVIGFPHGGSTAMTKAAESRDAVQLGADELDMVLNLGALKSGNLSAVEEEIRGVVNVAGGRIVKVIFETALLNEAEIVAACKASEAAGASFVKTSTGFSTRGATIADVELMRSSVGPNLKVKASGGIRSHDDAVSMLSAGAERLGTTATKEILSGVTEGLTDDRY